MLLQDPNATMPAEAGPILITYGILTLVSLIVMIAALVKAAKTPEAMLSLPKVAWVLIIIFLGLLGSICFFVFGRRKDAPRVH